MKFRLILLRLVYRGCILKPLFFIKEKISLLRLGLKTDERFELMMISQSIFENLEPMPNAADELNYDDQVYEDVDGYESLRQILKYKSLNSYLNRRI